VRLNACSGLLKANFLEKTSTWNWCVLPLALNYPPSLWIWLQLLSYYLISGGNTVRLQGCFQCNSICIISWILLLVF
jgi:hypothetical protein